jgi:RNA polymerase sigma factor (sigma-70 family)
MTPILVQRHAGDKAFERLYRAHVQDVYRYALMVLRNRDDAEDVAQTTFLKAYRAFERGERPRHPRRWLITIAHNTCGTRIRDARRRPHEVALEEQRAEALPAGTDDVDVQELVHALGVLSFNQRSALVMRELEGRTYVEIAEVLALSTSAVETLLFRARRALREQLEGTLACGEVEGALSLQLDGRLPKDERQRLRAHLRECAECASLARRQRARRAALRGLGPVPLPPSLASWGGGAAAGTGIAVKAAAVLAAGVAAVGATQQAADALRAAPAREGSQPVAVTLAHVPRATSPSGPVPRATERPAASARATKQRRTALGPDAAPASLPQAEHAAVLATPTSLIESKQVTLELPAVEVEVPSTPTLPVEVPQVVLPAVPVLPVVPDVQVPPVTVEVP